jgi:hypothetical protein
MFPSRAGSVTQVIATILILSSNPNTAQRRNVFSQAPMAHTYNPGHSGGRNQDLWSQPGQIVREILSQKYPRQNRAGRVAQVIECLPSKCKTLSSNPSTTKRKKSFHQHWYYSGLIPFWHSCGYSVYSSLIYLFIFAVLGIETGPLTC